MMTLNSEFIGSEAQIIESSNKKFIGLTGNILDESKHTFIIKTTHGTKMIPKEHNVWKIGNEQVINGSLISKRPEDRIKVKA